MRWLVAIPIVLASVRAGAEPWKLDLDLGGDRVQIALSPDGALEIREPGHRTMMSVGKPVSAGELHAGVVAGVPTIVADVTALGPAGDGESIIFERGAPGSWHEALRVPSGSIGDGDYSVALEVRPEAVFRYQVRGGYHRCDGKPAYLFAEGYTSGAGKLKPLSKIPVDVGNDAPVIAAHVDPASATHPVLYRARAASHEPDASDAGALGIPTALDDGNLTTLWTEGFAASAGEGQFFTFEPRAAGVKPVQLRVIAAPNKTFDRPRRLAVVWATGAVHVELPDAADAKWGTAYVADLPATASGCVSVILESVYGPANGQTAIAELEVYGEDERTGGGDAMLAAAIAGGDDSQTAAQALARRGEFGVAAAVAELAKPHDAAARIRLVRAVMHVRDVQVPELLARALAEGWLSGPDVLDAIAALGTLGDFEELRAIARAHDRDLGVRMAAVRALAEHPEQTVELAGEGPRQLRHAVIDVLVGDSAAALVRAASGQTAAAASGDLWRAATRRAHTEIDARPAVVAAAQSALAVATDYERRSRLVGAIAAFGDDAALHALAALLQTWPANADTAAYEQVAAHELADNHHAEATSWLITLVRDRDPGVRLAAIAALANDSAGGDSALTGALASDTWPEVRRRAAQSLGERCSRAEPATALVAAVARDPELSVRGDALAALVQCKAAGTAELLARTWDDPKAPLELRRRAIDLVVALEDRALAGKLVGKLAAWRGAALDSTEALALVQNAAYAIGRLAPPGAAEALTAGLDDSAFPEIIAASATGLGLLGAACPATARTKLRTLARAEERQVSLAAARAAALCGK